MDLTTGVAVSVRHPVHDVLAAHTGVEAGQLLVDLGCGHGTTLAAVAARTPGAVLVGIDIAADSLVSAAGLLGGAALMARADLSRPLPLPDATVDVIVCHNVMELLVDPAALFTEIGRVLRVGGLAVLSHADFAHLVVHGAEPVLTARILHAYAHLPQPWMAHIDPHAARRLPGLARRAGLNVASFCGHVAAAESLTGQARRRVEEIAAAVRGHARRGQVDLTARDVDQWHQQLEAADHTGGFAFAETTLITVARPAPR